LRHPSGPGRDTAGGPHHLHRTRARWGLGAGARGRPCPRKWACGANWRHPARARSPHLAGAHPARGASRGLCRDPAPRRRSRRPLCFGPGPRAAGPGARGRGGHPRSRPAAAGHAPGQQGLRGRALRRAVGPAGAGSSRTAPAPGRLGRSRRQPCGQWLPPAGQPLRARAAAAAGRRQLLGQGAGHLPWSMPAASPPSTGTSPA
jgi:hypothetical protein